MEVKRLLRFEPIGYSDGGNVPVTTEDYGYYFRESTRVIVNAQDLAPSSGLDQINYRMIDINGKEITGTEKCVQDQIAFEIPEGFKGKIYTTAIDHVGHIGAEQSLEGIIQENSRLHESTSNIQLLKPETTRKDAQGLDLYNTNIPITMHVEDLYSGIRSIDWKIEAYGDPDQNQSGHLEINNLGELLNDEGWGVVASQHNLRTILEKTIIVQNNSNEIRVTLTFTDRAGNQSSSYIVFSIDKTMPQIDVSYTNNEDDVEFEGFFKEPRIAEIVVTERNFNEKDAILTVTKDGEIISPVLDWSESGGTGNGDDITHTARISYDTDGDYTFAFQYGDLAGNASTDINYGNSATPTEFTIDGTAPVITLSYNNVAATGKGNYYFQEARIGTIQIEEHNFEASRANVIITSKDNNGNDLGNAPTVLPTDWNSVGDKRTAEVAFNAENANYSIAVQYTDQAGNQATPIEEQTFCMDQNDPIIEITGIMDRHAYNQEIIQPVVTFRDVNLDVNQTIITLSGSTLGELDLTGQDNSTADTRTFEFDNIEKDDIYTLFASVTDNAGRSNQIQYRFSVNRLGSTYELSKETSEMNHSYTNSPNDVVVREINVNALSQDSVNVTMSKDNKPSDLRENTDYDLKKEGQDGEWSVYTYTIYKSNFKEDGNYGIRLYSVDEAKNISQNNLDDENKRAEINFHVDKTSPNLSILNLNDGETYPEDSKMVKISVNDNTYVKEIQVRLNEKELKTYHLEEIQKKADQNENYEIEIANSDDSQELQVFALDAAGNSKEAKVVDFYVTTNLWIRFVNNKVVLYSTIMGVILVLASGIAIVFLKKKKPKKQQSA